MRNREKWRPSKFEYAGGKLVASPNELEVGLGSRLIVNLVACHYDRYTKQHARGRLIDLGCGRVPLYDVYKNYVTDNVCVDWINTIHRNDFVDYECDLSQALPFCDEAFETIIISDVLEHIPNPDVIWREMSRILARGGKILLNVPFYYWLHEQPHDYYRYTKFALMRFAESVGLKIVLLQVIGGAPEIIADILSKNLLRLRVVGKCLAKMVQFLTFKFIQTRIGRKISEATSGEFPFGYFVVVEKPI